jgi:hypothetical protein
MRGQEGLMNTDRGSAMMFEQPLWLLKRVLAADHDRLERIFQAIATRASAGDFQYLESEWFAFQDALLSHLEAEDKYLIQEVAVERPGEANDLLDEHARIRVELLRLGFDFDRHCWSGERVDAFAAALRAHAEREERAFYPDTDRSYRSSHDEQRGTAPGFATPDGAR